ncbi:MAG: DNA mismatch repair protein MutS [Lentisphaerae bacterium]|jgi:DNA mismatch repair protein MutS|nr:DNA mismatch repair protein MutS [Lentisphaerota bacterium]MBT4821415.1 DNA mismatch repair protein MutS [Lentisphaerota bacterium]MBT5612604.1 DNA mismatch repair protein MutS [Lentisphaerota bacterium]MBT7059263.1 DNA mismatch repair protein MutS [Lentisphaerota bacterium]MBT7845806.1 DNA mismatch repair protein MutS [Lentisphaerota bacterium]
MTAPAKLTPAMRQYMQAKKEVSEDTILLFRMGDFYELFFEDAKRAAPLMDIVLTQRAGVPMCGVPYHALRTYVSRMLAGGVKVAIAEQVEDPKKAKGLVKRAITQVITPGTVLDDDVLSASRSNFLAAITTERGKFGLALLDVSTGDFRITEGPDLGWLETELHRSFPAECLVPETIYQLWEREGFPDAPGKLVWTPLEDWLFDVEVATDRLLRHFEVGSLDGFGCRGLTLPVGAAGAVFYYAQNNLRQDAAHITGLQVYQTDECLVLDRISQRNLELVEPIFSEAKGATLLSVLDQTVTPMGGRLLRDWILRPLRDRDRIVARLDVTEALLADPILLAELREALGAVRDLERTIVRLNIGSANARDLLVLERGLGAVPGLRTLLESIDASLMKELREDLVDLPETTDLIQRAIVEEPPIALRDGGIIRTGHNDALDELHQAATEGKSWIAGFQTREQERTGIKSLKIRFNKVFGYYIEITKSNLEMVPEDYIRKQTLVNAERYITGDLKEIEDKVLGAEEKSKSLEYELFQEVRGEVVKCTPQIQRLARAVGTIDVLASLADTAGRYDYCRPEISDDTVIDIKDGRHPVLDALMQDERFVPNDTLLDTAENQLAIITGPNMAGKSTYIRQVALLVLMAQMGGYVPAGRAKIGLADRIFTRVGAADDIARGQSTFMVEMVEAANILNNATSDSLIILDELGRGTSTFDGLSLAWAVAEHLHDHAAVKARTLFATHYHELTELALTRSGVKNYNIAVKEWADKIIFLRKIMPGGTDKSYGIHVARLAGLPKVIIDRANEVLTNLEGDALEPSGKPKLARTRNRRRKSRPDPDSQLTFEL